MTDPSPDPLEAELISMKPVDLSPALRQRISEALAQSAQQRPQALWVRRAALLVAAACIALVAWLVFPDQNKHPSPDRVSVDAPITRTASIATLADYRRALADSPARLDALLDAQAALPMGSTDTLPPEIRAAAPRSCIP